MKQAADPGKKRLTINESQENYLERILLLQRRKGYKPAMGGSPVLR